MGLKHRLKGLAREVYARVVAHTGLHVLFDRWSPRRLTILYGHCVADEGVNGDLDPEMKVSEARLERLLRALGRRYELTTIEGGVARLDEGGGRSCVALSMDDGYRDNLTRLLPLLERVDGRATVFLEAGAVLERRLPWLHALGHLLTTRGAGETARLLADGCPDAEVATQLGRATDGNRIKRLLKYDAPRDWRDARLAELVAGEADAVLARLYMDRDEAQRLGAGGRVELGGHTVDHPVLSRVPAAEQRAQIGGGRDRMTRALGDGAGATFAYPYGRRWDFDDGAVDAARAAGYRQAVTTHQGTNRADADRLRLARWPIEEHTPLHLLVTEACGAFEFLRRRGLDLVE